MKFLEQKKDSIYLEDGNFTFFHKEWELILCAWQQSYFYQSDTEKKILNLFQKYVLICCQFSLLLLDAKELKVTIIVNRIS